MLFIYHRIVYKLELWLIIFFKFIKKTNGSRFEPIYDDNFRWLLIQSLRGRYLPLFYKLVFFPSKTIYARTDNEK